MGTILCTKEFDLTVKPDPTFQGLLWKVISSTGTPTWTAAKERFNLTVNAGPSGGANFHANGGDGTNAGQILIPATAQQRNCKLHMDVTIIGLNYSFPLGANELNLHYNQVAPPVAHTLTVPAAALTFPGSHDYAFVLAAGKAYTLNLFVDHQSQVFSGAGNFLNLSWNGFFYVETYS